MVDQTHSEQSNSGQNLVQITRHHGSISRVKPGHGPPVIELHLGPNERVVSIELTEDWTYGDRKTSDWSWTAYVETRL